MVEDLEKRIGELERENALYKEMLAAVYVLYEASRMLDTLPTNPEDEATLKAWDHYWDATEDLFDFVRPDEPQMVVSA